jgi:3-oxoacyl-[acyl-carrier protein] reductase
MNIDLKGKTALVTASTRGIGLAVARGLHAAGANICINGRDEKSLAEATHSIGQTDSGRIFSLAGDIADPDFLSQLTEKSVEHFRAEIDILVNNSGGPPPGEALSISEEQWQRAINANLLSVIRLCALVIPGMKAKSWGRIINLTSTAAKEPAAGMVLSNVTRAGVAAYGKTLAQEAGPFGITANTILTGGCLTDRLRSLLEGRIKESGESIDEAIASIEKTIPVRHIASPEEFAQTVLFLASPQASYINGTAIPVDGGTSKSTY